MSSLAPLVLGYLVISLGAMRCDVVYIPKKEPLKGVIHNGRALAVAVKDDRLFFCFSPLVGNKKVQPTVVAAMAVPRCLGQAKRR